MDCHQILGTELERQSRGSTVTYADDDGSCVRKAQGARRSRQQARRCHRVEFSLTNDEFAALEEAARRAGLARGAYAAQAAVAAARGLGSQANPSLREALREFIRASGFVRRVGVNLNQAVAELNATGQPSGNLLPYAAECLRRAERLDAVAEGIRKALR
jgi:hypothetical protein